jgi:hypothetical protein
MVVHTYNLCYWGGRSPFKTSLGKKLVRPHMSTNKVGMVACTCNPSYLESARLRSKAIPRQKLETLSKK